MTLSSDYQDRCEGVFGKSSPLYEVHSPQILRTPAVQIPYEMLCLHPLQLPCSVVDALYQLVEKAPQQCSTIGVKGVAQGHVAVVHHHLDHLKSFV